MQYICEFIYLSLNITTRDTHIQTRLRGASLTFWTLNTHLLDIEHSPSGH